MKTFLFLTIVNVRRAIISIPFLISSCGIMFVMLFSAWGLITTQGDADYLDVIYLYTMGTGGGSIFLMTGILPIFPFATSFASEWGQRATNFWIVRSGVRNYSVSKVFVSALSGFLATWVGLCLFIVLMRLNRPLLTFPSSGDAYASLLEQDMPIRYLLFHMTHISLTSALFAVVAIWISTYIPNQFVAVASPLVVYFMMHRFTTELEIPEYLQAISIVEGTYHAQTPILSLLVKLGIVATLCLLMGYATVRQIRRRVQHD